MLDIDAAALEQALQIEKNRNRELENASLKEENQYLKKLLSMFTEKLENSDPILFKAISSYLKDDRISFIGFTVKETLYVKAAIGLPPKQRDRWLDSILEADDWRKCQILGHPVHWNYIFTTEDKCDDASHEKRPHAHISCRECDKNWMTYEGSSSVYYRSLPVGTEVPVGFDDNMEFTICPDDVSDAAKCPYSALGAHQHTRNNDVTFDYHPSHDEARAKWERRRIDPEIKSLFRRASNP